MNKVVLMGRLTKDPDYRTAEKTTVARYTLAVNRIKKDDPADFINCVAFGKAADFANLYLHKGNKICLSGHIQTGNYTDKEGRKVYTTDVVVESQEFAESKHEEAPADGYLKPTDDFVKVPEGEDDELPFA